MEAELKPLCCVFWAYKLILGLGWLSFLFTVSLSDVAEILNS